MKALSVCQTQIKVQYDERGNTDPVGLVADSTMRGVAKKDSTAGQATRGIKDQKEVMRTGLEGLLTVKRKDYSIQCNPVLEIGVVMDGEELEIEINLEAVQLRNE